MIAGRGAAMILGLTVGMWLSVPAGARADEPGSRGEEQVPDRPLPDYDGRPEPSGVDPVDVLLWIPRILTSPLYLISEYILRRPHAFVLTELERAGALDALLANGNGGSGLIPTVFYEFGLSPSVGVYAFWDQFAFRENRISAHAAFFADEWVRVRVRDRVQFDPTLQLAIRFEGSQRPDPLVEGIGYDATQTERARFFMSRIELGVELHHRPWRASRLDYQVGIRTIDFRDQGWEGDPSISQRLAAPLAGYPAGYEAAFLNVSLVLDTHVPHNEMQTARFRVGLFADPHIAFGDYDRGGAKVAAWVRFGGEIAGSTDFLGDGRVLMLRGRAAVIAPIDDAVIPFTELLDVGGRGPLPGFVTGQLRGYSYAAVTLEYIWPVWALLDGSLWFSVGNAFGIYYEDFEPERLRLAFGVGVVPRVDGEHLFELGVGFGTETFENGTEVTSVRFTVGGRSGL